MAIFGKYIEISDIITMHITFVDYQFMMKQRRMKTKQPESAELRQHCHSLFYLFMIQRSNMYLPSIPQNSECYVNILMQFTSYPQKAYFLAIDDIKTLA
jgi:hypothetical protein